MRAAFRLSPCGDGGCHGGNNVQVSVFESVAVYFESDDFGVSACREFGTHGLAAGDRRVQGESCRNAGKVGTNRRATLKGLGWRPIVDANLPEGQSQKVLDRAHRARGEDEFVGLMVL